jgi:hypothetical protein
MANRDQCARQPGCGGGSAVWAVLSQFATGGEQRDCITTAYGLAGWLCLRPAALSGARDALFDLSGDVDGAVPCDADPKLYFDQPARLAQHLPGIDIPQAFTAFGTFLLRQDLRSLPLELEDAARIDGASSFAIYWRILLPLSGSALAALGIFTFLGQWNNLFWPLIVTTENSMRTLPVGLSYFRGQYGTQWNLLMAGTTIALLPVLLVFIAGQRFFVQGIAFSGMGGR